MSAMPDKLFGSAANDSDAQETREWMEALSAVIASTLTVLTQTAVEGLILVIFMIIIGNIGWTTLFILPILILLTFFAFGIGMIVALLNVRYRDVSYLTAVGLQVLFYATPIVYREDIVAEHKTAAFILKLNPMTHFVGSMRRALYQLQAPTLLNWTAMSLSAVFMVIIGWTVFAAKAPRFIEEI